MNPPRHLLTLAFAGVSAAVLTVGLAPAASASAGTPGSVLASGLDNPRHLQFGPDGVLYVAEAGSGGDQSCAAGAEGGTSCYGSTGAVTAIGRRGGQHRVVTGLPSFAGQGTGAQAAGPSDVAPSGRGLLVSVGLGRNPAERAKLPAPFQDAGWLLSADPRSDRTTRVADIAGFEATADPVKDPRGPDSNPNAVLATGSGAVVVDAGGNSLLRVSRKGQVGLIATFPTRPQTVGVQVPGGPPVGATVKAQSVPTSVTRAGGAYVVGELTGFPFAKDGAQLWRVDGSQPEVLASGFTNLIDVETGPHGTLYVLEIAKDGLLSAAPGQAPVGQLLRVGRDGAQQVVAELPAPGGLAIRGSTAYVSTNSSAAHAGQVVAVPLR